MTDDDIHAEVISWLGFRDEVLVLNDLLLTPDPRPEPDHAEKRHSPVFQAPFSTTCEICRQPIYKNSDLPSGYGVYMNRNEML